VHDRLMPRHWWVNQGQSYDPERPEGILWAPLRTTDGRSTRTFWESMDSVAPDDLILSYADQHVKAWSVALAPAKLSRRPDSLPTTMWEQDGRLLRTRYVDAGAPVHREEIPESWRKDEPREGPFQANMAVKLGYLFPLNEGFFGKFGDAFADRFDSWGAANVPVAPAEALDGATNLMRRLIGEDLHTYAGDINVILAVRSDSVLVRTSRSPDGQWVRTGMIETALRRLLRYESVSVGHANAFVGAVLATIPGTELDADLRTLRLAQSGIGASTSETDIPTLETLGFEGDLERFSPRTTRGEQGSLRRTPVGKATEVNCAICGQLLPVEFIWAAHIKKRSMCSDGEKRDLASIAMLTCVLGCDALYETGHVTVDDEGRILTVDAGSQLPLQRKLDGLAGLSCLAFNKHNAHYFRWHRENVFRGLLLASDSNSHDSPQFRRARQPPPSDPNLPR
jgi:hypothetical protein